jgi:hypothetical protein
LTANLAAAEEAAATGDDPEEEEEDFSFITGKFTRKQDAAANAQETALALQNNTTDIALLPSAQYVVFFVPSIHKCYRLKLTQLFLRALVPNCQQKCFRYLAGRTYSGLERKLGQSEVVKAVEGKGLGIAAGYTNEGTTEGR